MAQVLCTRLAPTIVINGGIIHINGRKQMGNCFLFHPLFFHGVISTYLCLQLVPLGPPSCRYRQTKMGFLGLTNQLRNLPMDSPHPAFVQLPTNPPTKTSSPRPTFWLLKKFPYTPGCLRFRWGFLQGAGKQVAVNFHPWKKENHLQK